MHHQSMGNIESCFIVPGSAVVSHWPLWDWRHQVLLLSVWVPGVMS